jgi:hypothetical protein
MIHRKSIFWAAVLGLAGVMVSGCWYDDEEQPPDPKSSRFISYLRIDSITFYDPHEGQFMGYPEMEVYLYDAQDGVPLGCSGAQHGLTNVDQAHSRYSGLHAPFENATGQYLWGTAHAGRQILIKMSEDDDSRPCPSPAPSRTDDAAGEAGPVLWEDLFGARIESPGNFIIEFEPVNGSPPVKDDGGIDASGDGPVLPLDGGRETGLAER